MAERIDLDWLREPKPEPIYQCWQCGTKTFNSLDMIFRTTSDDNNLRPWMCRECWEAQPAASRLIKLGEPKQ